MRGVLEEFLAQLNNLEDGDWYNMNDVTSLKEDE